MEITELRTEEETAALDRTISPAGERPVLRVALSRFGIGFRLMFWVLLFSSISVPFSAAFQLYSEYQREVGIIHQRLSEIGESTEASLASSMADRDTEQIRSLLGGILLLPDMRMVEARVNGLKDPIILRKDKNMDRDIVVREFPILHQEEGITRNLGVLHVEASLTAVRANIRRQGLIILAEQGLRNFIFALVMLVLYYWMVTRHLISFAAYLRRHDPLHAPPELALKRKPRTHPDELDWMVQSFNQTSEELYLVNRELAGANAALENDIAQRQEHERQLYRSTHYDELTGLANRILIVDRLQQAIANSERNGSFSAVLLLDLDNFKSVNDTCGHASGDELLRQTAARLKDCVRGGDTVSRMGGDEFLILLPSMENTIDAQKVLERVEQAFVPPFEISNQSHYITTSIGVAVFPTDGGNDTELMCNADSALYQAKALGRNRYQFFTAEINERVQRRLGLERRLRGAAGRGEFVLYYQPIVSASSDLLTGFEALVRWRQPDGTLEAPGTFIAVAEEVGLIDEIGNWVMETACQEGTRLAAGFPSSPRVCVNVSPRQLRVAEFADFVKKCLDEAGMAPKQLEIEITEGVLMDERPEVAHNIAQLCDFGIRLSIDDFGTGYSSLAYLQHFPFDTLKIDQSFVSNLGSDRAAQRLVEGIINMARGLGLETVAEGVETEGQRAFLLSLGCDCLQGYLLGRPAPMEKHLNLARPTTV